MHAMLLQNRSAVSDTTGLIAQAVFLSVNYSDRYIL